MAFFTRAWHSHTAQSGACPPARIPSPSKPVYASHEYIPKKQEHSSRAHIRKKRRVVLWANSTAKDAPSKDQASDGLESNLVFVITSMETTTISPYTACTLFGLINQDSQVRPAPAHSRLFLIPRSMQLQKRQKHSPPCTRGKPPCLVPYWKNSKLRASTQQKSLKASQVSCKLPLYLWLQME